VHDDTNSIITELNENKFRFFKGKNEPDMKP
jgi:hypothetical protein